jgi:NADPH-dependent curcumin reductase CurA
MAPERGALRGRRTTARCNEAPGSDRESHHRAPVCGFRLADVGRPNVGDTVLVSAAARALGSIVCQIAKVKACRVVGIAGGQRKCGWLRDEIGVDAIDYKGEGVQARLAELCPSGINVFFDNVGGEILDAGHVSSHLALASSFAASSRR